MAASAGPEIERLIGLLAKLPGMTRFSHTYYLRPRKVEQVICTDC